MCAEISSCCSERYFVYTCSSGGGDRIKVKVKERVQVGKIAEKELSQK